MSNNAKDQDGLTRRDFTTRVGAAAAGLAVGGEFFRVSAQGNGRRVLGANDRVVTASIGVHGQGNALKQGFARLKNVQIKTLCDIDANLADERFTRYYDDVEPGLAQFLHDIVVESLNP